MDLPSRYSIMELLAHVLLAAIAGFGMAIVLVEKKTQWPATMLRPPIAWILSKIYHKLPEMLECSVCTSFWTALFADLLLSLYTKFSFWPLWPLTGFVCLAITWTVIELMNAIDPK